MPAVANKAKDKDLFDDLDQLVEVEDSELDDSDAVEMKGPIKAKPLCLDSSSLGDSSESAVPITGDFA